MSVRRNPFDDEVKTDPGRVPDAARPSLVPWGLLIALAIYAAVASGFAVWHLWHSPDYQAARHYRMSVALLGKDRGRTATRETLVEAYGDLLEAAVRVPEVRDFHDALESLNWRFEERHWTIPGDLRRRAEAVATLYTRIQMERRPLLAVGARDRGWDPDQLLDEPMRLAFWFGLGGMGIVVAWAYLRFGERARRESERNEQLSEVEREVAQSERERQRVIRKVGRPPRSPLA
jgi:hypothetical protein